MTVIENDSPKAHYRGPFNEGQLLPLTFPYTDKTHVFMLIDGTPAIYNVDYEIITEVSEEHPIAYPNSAYIKRDMADVSAIVIFRETPLDQQADFPQNSKFRSERIEQALDKICMEQQEQEEKLSRCIVAPITLETFNGQLPEPEPDTVLKWNEEGKELENYDIIGAENAFKEEVRESFATLENEIDNTIQTFETEVNQKIQNINQDVQDFEANINEVLDEVLNAADQLENLDNSVVSANNSAEAAADSATAAAESSSEAKYYAEESNQSALNAQSFAQSAQDSYNQVQAVSEQALINIETKTNESSNELETVTEQNIEEIIIEKNNSITNIQEVSATEQAELEEIRDDIINYAGIYYEEITDEVVDVNLLESGYVSDNEFEEALATKQDKGNYALVDDVPTLVSELENDSNYATQTQVMQAIASIPQFKMIIVDALPETGEKMTLYFVPKEGTEGDIYNEYVWIDETQAYEFLGSTAVDLTDYVKKTDYAGNTGGVIKSSVAYSTKINDGFLTAVSETLGNYNVRPNASFVSKGTLENIKDDYVKRAVTENDIELTDEEKTSARTWLGTANDSAVVHLAGSETITGVKSFTLPDNIRFTASKTTGYTPSMTNAQTGLTPVTNVPWSRNGWHDHFAFGQSFTVASKEVTTDGESWVADDRDISYLFAQKEYGATGEIVQAPNAGEMGFRFVLQSSNIAYSNIQWIEIGFAYSSPHTVRLLIESSSNGTEWTEVHNSTTSATAKYQYLYVGNLSSGNTYLRISVIKVDTSYLDIVTRMLYVKGWTTRKGNQGRGIEYEYPYYWDNIPNLMPVKSGNNLGSTTRRWGTTYTTNLNVGGQILNNTHITKLNDLPTTLVLTEADYNALETKDANTLYLIEE